MSEEITIINIDNPQHQGHSLFEINHTLKQVILAEFATDEGDLSGRKKLVVKPGCEYVYALNMKNAVKQYNKRT